MLRRRLLQVSVASSVAALLPASGSGQAQRAIEIPIATYGSPTNVGVREFVPVVERIVADRSQGRMRVAHFPGGQLGQDRDFPTSVPLGQVKFAWTTLNNWTGTVPDTRVFDLPTGLTMDQMQEAVDRPNTGLRAALAAPMAARNVEIVAFIDLGAPVIVSKRPVLAPGDLRGMKIRVFSEGGAELMRLAGAAPVSINFAEVYTSLQSGAIDAALIGFPGIESQRITEVANHCVAPGAVLGTSMSSYVVNRPWLNAMPEADRTIIRDASREGEANVRRAVRTEYEEMTTRYRQRGMTVTFLTADMPQLAEWQRVVRPALERARGQVSEAVFRAVMPG